MQVLSEYHLIEEREVVLVVPLTSFCGSVSAWLLPRALFESFDFSQRPHKIHLQLRNYEINCTLQRVIGFEV